MGKRDRRRWVPRFDLLEVREVPAANAFTIVALPDTQHYAEQPALNSIFYAQTQWIVDHRVDQNIAFVTGLGDIVHHGANIPQEWVVADAAYDKLDGNLQVNPNGLVPYLVPPGNHDYNVVSDRSSGDTYYLNYFGQQRLEGRDWYGGSYLGKNHFAYFSGGGTNFLAIALEWEATDDVLDWARQVLRNNPGLPTVISTHSYVWDTSESRRVTRQSSDGNSGEAVFRKLVYNNPQIFMVLNGHFHSAAAVNSGEWAQVSTNVLGQPVFEMCSDYQERPGQNSGLLRLLRFEPEKNRIDVKTYSPNQDLFETDANSQFSFYVDFAARFRAGSPDVVNVSNFQEGVDFGFGTYTGTQDTTLRQASPDVSLANDAGDLLVAAASAANASQTLIRFDNIIGAGVGQVPYGARILNASLYLDSNNSGAGATFHRAFRSWSEADTWNTWVGGAQADNVEARASYDSQAGMSTASPPVPAEQGMSVNVTADLTAWVNGSLNRGWVALPWAGGTDDWGFSPSEAGNQTLRPRLRVEWVPAATNVAVFQQGVNGYSGTADTEIRQTTPATQYNTANTIWVDGASSNDARQVLLRFDNLFAGQGGPILRGATINSALLYLTTSLADANSPGGGTQLTRMIQPWGNVTWGGSFGGNGIQRDGIEAETSPDWNTGSADFGPLRLDVTASLRQWHRGAPNYGWALLDNSTDGWMIASAEAEAINDRPKLVVLWSPPPRSKVNAPIQVI